VLKGLLMELLVRLVLLVKLGPKETQVVPQELQVLKGQLVLRVHQASQGHPVLKVQQVLKGQLVLRVHQVHLALQALQAPQVKQVPQVSLVLLAVLVQRAKQAQQVP
jgi:hypothetical protein